MLADTGDIERVADDADTHHDEVVFNRERRAFEEPFAVRDAILQVQPHAPALIEANTLACRADRLDDAAEFDRAHRRAGQQRREQEMVAGADDSHVVGVHIKVLDEAERGETSAKDE